MKKLIIGMAATALLSSSAFAARYNSRYQPKSSSQVAKGLRVGLRTGGLDFELKATLTDSFSSESSTFTESGDATAFSIGYQQINVQDIGFMFQYNRENIDVSDNDLSRNIFEGNATYGINGSAYLYGGLNYSRFTDEGDGEGLDEIDGGFGVQLAGGYQINDNIAAELKYTTTNNQESATEDGETLDLEIRTESLQVGILGTF